MYMVEVHSCASNDCNISRNFKKAYVSSMQGHFQKDITVIEVVLRSKYKDIELVYLCVGD